MKTNYFPQIKVQAEQFLEMLFFILQEQHIEINKHWNIDHLCFRTTSDEDYSKHKKDFQEFSELLIESEVNGRMISTFKLHQPIFIKDWSIDLIELPAPKKGKPTKSGFEHIEVVIDIPFEEIRKKFPKNKFDEGGLAKDFNQELEIGLGDYAIKFHHLSLESVINVEKNRELFQAIKQLNILRDLKAFGPLVSGTYPLAIHTDKSDIDIILNSDDLSSLQKQLARLYGQQSGYKAELDPNLKILVVEFQFNGFNFELYAENKNSVIQNSNLHFILQERLLKLGTRSFKERIIRLKNLGTKTEPAFAHVMGLTGDPYMALMEIRQKSENELRNILNIKRF